jgi:hypothetical protein
MQTYSVSVSNTFCFFFTGEFSYKINKQKNQPLKFDIDNYSIKKQNKRDNYIVLLETRECLQGFSYVFDVFFICR